MSRIVPPTTIPEPEGHVDTGPTYDRLRARTLARRALAVTLFLAAVGLAVLLAGAAEVGAALFFPGLVGAMIAAYRLAHIPGLAVADYRRPPYARYDGHAHWFRDFSGGDWGGGDFGGGGGDGGG
jgi:uncharacterized membrane protein YgcG